MGPDFENEQFCFDLLYFVLHTWPLETSVSLSIVQVSRPQLLQTPQLPLFNTLKLSIYLNKMLRYSTELESKTCSLADTVINRGERRCFVADRFKISPYTVYRLRSKSKKLLRPAPGTHRGRKGKDRS
jgi:hypothetical protein